MFGFFRKKPSLEELIDNKGLDYAACAIAKETISKIKNRDMAFLFILEELDGASQGNQKSKKFAETSGVPFDVYRGTLNSISSIDGPDGPQQVVARHTLTLINNTELMAKFRCAVADKVMAHYKIGKYSDVDEKQLVDIVNRQAQNDFGEFSQLAHDLETFAQDNKTINVTHTVGYEYANMILVAGMFFQGLIKHNDYIFSKSMYFETIKKAPITSHEISLAEKQGVEFLIRYIPNLTDFSVLAILKLADAKMDFYALADKLNMPVNSEPPAELQDEVAFMSVGDCLKIIEIAKQISDSTKSA